MIATSNAVNHNHDCINRPHPTELPGHPVQIGWKDGKRVMSVVRTQWNDMACGHSERASDDACGNCRWRYQ